jgi:hypothetical protein
MIKKEIKVQQYGYDDKTQVFVEPEYLSYNTEYRESIFPLSVSGYDSVIEIRNISQVRGAKESLYPYLTFDPDKQILTYYYNK